MAIPQKTKLRIDVLLVEKGFAPSRERAQALILSGNVLVNDVPITKPGTTVEVESLVRIKGSESPWVSRAAAKLEAAFEQFSLTANNRLALDVGASTGGFTEVLLKRGANRVIALDVGHNQMDWKIRSDPRVTCLEGVNARHLKPGDLKDLPASGKVDLITIDVSFISVAKILPALLPLAELSTDWIVLIKPQFEVGRGEIGKRGVVTSDSAREKAVLAVTQNAESLGLHRLGLIESPITGTQGNREYLAHFRLGA